MAMLGGKVWRQWTTPVGAGFCFAWLVIALIGVPAVNSLTWPGLFRRSGGLMLLAAVCGLAMVWAVCRIFRQELGRSTQSLRAYVWSACIWLPLLTLLWNEHAIWMVLAPLPIAGILTHFVRRQTLAAQAVEYEDEPIFPYRSEMFERVSVRSGLPIARKALVLTLLLQVTIWVAATGSRELTESMLVALTAAVVWCFTTTAPRSAAATSVMGNRGRRAAVLPCFALTCLALMPFLPAGLVSSGWNATVMAGVAHPMAPMPKLKVPQYAGIVLLAPPLPKQRVLEPAPASLSTTTSTVITQRKVIKFDGAYQYFEVRPPTGTRGVLTQRGNSLKANVHSADNLPLTMEARQRLGNRVNGGCCSGMELALTNADTRFGSIGVEMVLRDIGANGVVQERSLGTVPLKSSVGDHIALNRPAVAETLRFPMKNAAGMRFNEIAVHFHLAPQRNRAGAKVAIREFVLQP